MRRCFGACPQLALTAHVGGPGDCNGGHFDGNAAVVSLLLSEADSGGEFEYVSCVRDEATRTARR